MAVFRLKLSSVYLEEAIIPLANRFPIIEIRQLGSRSHMMLFTSKERVRRSENVPGDLSLYQRDISACGQIIESVPIAQLTTFGSMSTQIEGLPDCYWIFASFKVCLIQRAFFDTLFHPRPTKFSVQKSETKITFLSLRHNEIR